MLSTTLRRLAPAFLLAAASAAVSARLPGEVYAALDRAKVPPDSVVIVVQEAGGTRSRLAWRDSVAVNPASLTKLLTTYAALDLLGPAWSWSTPVWLQGTVNDGVLEGNLVIKGSGDPKLVPERLWLLMRRVATLRALRSWFAEDAGSVERIPDRIEALWHDAVAPFTGADCASTCLVAAALRDGRTFVAALGDGEAEVEHRPPHAVDGVG